MSEDGKDTVIFASRKDHSTKSKIELPVLQPPPGVILPNGEINWLCPCLGGLATGPCGVPFRNAFSCFHFSRTDPKGSDCLNAFKVMQDCMVKHPKLYKNESVPQPLLSNQEASGDPMAQYKPTKDILVSKK